MHKLVARHHSCDRVSLEEKSNSVVFKYSPVFLLIDSAMSALSRSSQETQVLVLLVSSHLYVGAKLFLDLDIKGLFRLPCGRRSDSTYLQTSHECLTSPLNHTLPSLTTAYVDTDVEFASRGSFFHSTEGRHVLKRILRLCRKL
eukprot:GILK01023169.1.p1 GENE.GILK01023169.1~~GILK01023169.1.p1  ORF type:complete len:144 (+),score=2.78 GILK01023169.1:348-779(+)